MSKDGWPTDQEHQAMIDDMVKNLTLPPRGPSPQDDERIARMVAQMAGILVTGWTVERTEDKVLIHVSGFEIPGLEDLMQGARLRETLAMAEAREPRSEGAGLLARITVDVTARRELGIEALEVVLGRREYAMLMHLLLRYGDGQTICGVPYRVVEFEQYYEVLP